MSRVVPCSFFHASTLESCLEFLLAFSPYHVHCSFSFLKLYHGDFCSWDINCSFIKNKNGNRGEKHCQVSHFYKLDVSYAIQLTFSKVIYSDR